MNKTFSFLALSVFALCVQGAEKTVSVIQSNPYCFPYHEFRVGYSISNGSKGYGAGLTKGKNTAQTPSRLRIDFCRPVELTVNGIRNTDIVMERDSLKKWEDKESGDAGCEALLNFDGAKLIFRAFMKKDSDLLFVRIIPDSSSVEPITSIVFSTYACTNLDKDAKKRWTFETYSREVRTPKRTIKARQTTLEPDENKLVCSDAIYGKDPVYMIFESAPVRKASLINGPYQALTLTLDPAFKEFTFAFWKSGKKVLTNEEFEALLKKSPELFKF